MNLLQIFILIFNIFLIHAKKHKHKHKQKDKTVQIVPSLSVQIPVISSGPVASCPCAASGSSGPCNPSIYIDYYYNPPYTGYPANSSYLPPADSIPSIVNRLTSIRDLVKNFVQSAKNEKDDVKQALYIKNNYGDIHYLLKAISKAANNTST